LREVTLESRKFFRNIGTIGEESDFLKQAIVVRRQLEAGLLDSIQ